MKQYITFKDSYKGINGYLYQKGTKFLIKSSDTKYLYSMSDKIKKDDLAQMSNDDYKIGDVNEGRYNG